MTDEEIMQAVKNKVKKEGFADFSMYSCFTKEFAQAFWKDEENKIVTVLNEDGSSVITEYEGWQYWLSQFVLADDPYEYLARFLTNIK